MIFFDSNLNNAVGSVSNAGTTVDFGVSQLLTSLDIGDDSVVTLADLSGPPPAPLAGLEAGFGADLGGASIQGVPEPGSAALLVGGVLTLLGMRRRRA